MYVLKPGIQRLFVHFWRNSSDTWQVHAEKRSMSNNVTMLRPKKMKDETKNDKSNQKNATFFTQMNKPQTRWPQIYSQLCAVSPKRLGMFTSSGSLPSSLSWSRLWFPGSAMLLRLSLSNCSGSSTCKSEPSTLLLVTLFIRWLSSCCTWSCDLSSAIRLRTTLYWLSFYYNDIWEKSTQ